MLLPDAAAALNVVLPEATRQIAVRVTDGEAQTTVRARSATGASAQHTAPGHPSLGRTIVLDLPDWADDIVIDLTAGAGSTA